MPNCEGPTLAVMVSVIVEDSTRFRATDLVDDFYALLNANPGSLILHASTLFTVYQKVLYTFAINKTILHLIISHKFGISTIGVVVT
jgi:aminoglycoside N3'-acetyltransferase